MYLIVNMLRVLNMANDASLACWPFFSFPQDLALASEPSHDKDVLKNLVGHEAKNFSTCVNQNKSKQNQRSGSWTWILFALRHRCCRNCCIIIIIIVAVVVVVIVDIVVTCIVGVNMTCYDLVLCQ